MGSFVFVMYKFSLRLDSTAGSAGRKPDIWVAVQPIQRWDPWQEYACAVI